MGKRLTVAELLAKKEQLKQRKKRTQTIYVESLDAEIVIQEPSHAIALESLEMAHDPGNNDRADIHVVYHCVVEPNLKDAELQIEFGCAEPTDIVGKVFLPGEIAAISGHALQLAGYGTSVRKVDDDLKN